MKEDPTDPEHARFLAQLRRMNAETEKFVAEQRRPRRSRAVALLPWAAIFLVGAAMGGAAVKLAGW